MSFSINAARMAAKVAPEIEAVAEKALSSATTKPSSLAQKANGLGAKLLRSNTMQQPGPFGARFKRDVPSDRDSGYGSGEESDIGDSRSEAETLIGSEHEEPGAETAKDSPTALHGAAAPTASPLSTGRHTLLNHLQQNFGHLPQETLSALATSLITGFPSGPAPGTANFHEGLNQLNSQGGQFVRQQIEMQNAKANIDQVMEITKMIAEIRSKSIQNYDVKG